MQFVDREAALAFLLGRINHERKTDAPYRESVFKLDRMVELLARLGDPHLRMPIVHVAGTKGKGSTAAMIASVLAAADKRVGLYTSPHLLALEERFAVNGQSCTPAELVALTNQAADAVCEMDRQAETSGDETKRPTYFEVTTAMAWLHFVAHSVDLAVMEVGLGGRLDSTNLCRPLVCVITSISLDHVRQLGGTLAAIAAEKAGIIKPGAPVVSGVTAAAPAEVIARRALESGSPLWRLGREFDVSYRPCGDSRAAGSFDFSGEIFGGARMLKGLSVGLPGRHQAQNAAVAIGALARLQEAGWSIDEPSLRRGLATARCPARVEILSDAPAIVLDVAHNVASVAALGETLMELFPGRPKRLVFAASNDKDVAGMLSALWPNFEQIVLTTFRISPRSVPADELLAIARQVGESYSGTLPELLTADDAEAALRLAMHEARPEHVVCVTGSFFIAAEAKSVLAS